MEIKRIIGGTLEANGYIISDPAARECYIIDPGYQPGVFLRGVEEIQCRVLGILLTHHHYDHTDAVEPIRRELECPVFIHRADADAWGGHTDVYLEGGETLLLGDEKIQVIHTPGHTRGGVCFMAARSRVCFTGDTIFNVDLGRTDLKDGSDREMGESIRGIISGWENDIFIYPGHGDGCTMKKVREINREYNDFIEGKR